MEMEWGTREMGHQPSGDGWHNQSLLKDSLDSIPVQTSTPAAPPSAFASTSSGFSQRRRSSAANVRPAGPPPTLPIPNVPGSSISSLPPRGPVPPQEDSLISPTFVNGRGTRSSSFMRPGASPNLAAVASYSQTRESSASNNQFPSAESSIEDLSDPPPQSYLHASSSRAVDRHQDLVPDRLLLSPQEARLEPRAPSSRRALTRALELAREAVQLDSMNDNPEAAVQAYGRSVALLSEVMERVRRGEDSTESHRRRRRRSVAAQEEEVRRLQNIHDTYADRMNILSIIYSIPAVPYSSTLTYSVMTDSTASASPTNSVSPSSDSSPQIPHNPDPANDVQSGYHPYSIDNGSGHDTGFDSPGTPNPVIFTLDDSNFTQPTLSGLPSASHHPYAIQYDPPPQTNISSAVTNSTIHRRSVRARGLSNLPPPPPPPSNSLPPAPLVTEPASLPSQHLDTRIESIGHRRTGSSGLEALKEEYNETSQQTSAGEQTSTMKTTRLIPDTSHTPRNSNRDSHPLPPLPSPSMGSPGTPRNAPKPSLSPRPSHVVAPRPRLSSQSTTRSDIFSQAHIINATTTQGTIFQRRTTKSSAPPSSRSSSPADSMASVGSGSQSKTASSLPGAAPIGMIPGRSRSSSQPGRRPSLVGGRVSPLDQRPPLPIPASTNGTSKRKTSIPSKLNPHPPPSHISVITDLPQPPYGNGSFSLVPPPPIFAANLPTAPTSPLPPIPPSDPLLKPYHLMNLLRATMTSITGGYITRRLHVPYEVWSQGGAKLASVGDKVRVVAILCSALEDLQTSSSEHFGAGNVSSGLALGIGSIGRKEADAWLTQLDNFSSICDGVVTDFGKKLGVGEGFVPKKARWHTLARGLDKFTNGKNLDSPAAYVRGLEKLFLYAQLLDEHTRAVLSQPIAPAYAAFPTDIRISIEQRLKRASEFFASVVLTFVIRDLSQLLDKYAKKCEKWLAE